MLNFNHTYYFHIVALEGSIVRAAQRLGVTQPTVSEQVRQLERWLGNDLFERTPTGLKLTAAGRLAFAHTTIMFQAGERLLETVGRAPKPVARTLRIGISTVVSKAIAAHFLLPVLKVEDCFPSIRTGEFVELLHELRGFALDILLAETEPVESAAQELRVVPIHQPALVAVASDSLFGKDGKFHWADAPLLHYRAGSAFFFEIEDYLKANQLTPRVIGETDDSQLMLEAACSGACVSFVPRTIAKDALARGRVKALFDVSLKSCSIRAIYHSDENAALASRAVEQLVSYAKSNLNL
jgi:LysR family transcriptional activator of nhaA